MCAGIADFGDCLEYVLKSHNMQTIISACYLVIAHGGAIKICDVQVLALNLIAISLIELKFGN